MRLAILGAGGHARSVAGIAIEDLKLPVVAFVDLHSQEQTSEKIYELPVIPSVDTIEGTLEKLTIQAVILAIGDNQERNAVYLRLKNKYHFPNVISPSAVVKNHCTLGEGNIIFSHAYIGPCCAIGDNNILNTGCIVEHECKIGSSNHIAPHTTILGRVSLGNLNLIASGSTLSPNVKLKNQIVIGAHSFVNQNIEVPATYFGIPAKLASIEKKT
jgi:UDP-perosamine 4-acetyltransferase